MTRFERVGIKVNPKIKGTLYVFMAATLFSVGGLCFKVIPWHGLAINSARNMISIFVIGMFAISQRHVFKFNKTVLIGALCIAGTNNLFSLANKLTTAGNTIILQFTAPVFIIILSFIIFGTKPEKIDITACFLVLIGIGFFVVDGISTGSMLGNGLALLSGLSYAGVFMLNSSQDSDPLSSVLIGQAGSVLIGLPFLLSVSSFSATALLAVAVLGFLQLGLGFIFLTKGLQTTSAITASLVTGIEPILNPLWVALFYKEVLTPISMIGAVIVFVTIIAYNYKKAKKDMA
ncbi:MAG: EamA family transporter [Clostridia bacterium]|jgi:drug/metabolite transporter (DMT)-like permease|nr:EamA family transporter [Clostridia bacterium]